MKNFQKVLLHIKNNICFNLFFQNKYNRIVLIKVRFLDDCMKLTNLTIKKKN